MDDEALRQYLLDYRLTRDPGHIAALFEASAAQLWQLAMHLARDPADADDLLQSTYLAVIESVERYDAQRPAIGWMVGILTNQARSQKRRAGRWTDPDRLLEDLPSTPAETAQTEEERSLVNDAIASLPEIYRQVLELVVEKGIGPGEIAARLSRTPGTVRVQMHRAISLLRRGLPAGLALPVALMSVQSAGLESVRRSIHQAALKSSAGLGTGIALSKIAATVLGLAALGASTWAIAQSDSTLEPSLAAAPRAGLAVPGPGTTARADATEMSTPQDMHDRALPESQIDDVSEAAVPQVPAVQTMIPFEAIIRPGDGFDLETQSVVPPNRADFAFPKRLGRLKAANSTRLAEIPSRDPGFEWPSGSNDAYLRSVVAFDPERLEWDDELRSSSKHPTEAVFLVECANGYAVAALVNTRWNPERREDEALLRGIYNPVDALFSTRPPTVATTREIQIDLRAFEYDPFGMELDARRRDQLAQLDERARVVESKTHRLQGRVRAVLNRTHARTISDIGAYAAATFSFQFDTRDDVAQARNDWSIQLTGSDRLDIRMVTDDRSFAWRIPSGRVDQLPVPDQMGPGAEGFERLRRKDLFLIHTLDSETDRWDLLRVLELKRGKWLVFEWLPLEDPSWIDRYRAAIAHSGKRIQSNRILVQMRTGAGGGNPVRVFLDESVNAYLDETSTEMLELFTGPIDMKMPSRAYVEGGDVPPGKVFEIDLIEWRATTHGDSNGRGGLRIEVAGEEIVKVDETPGPDSGRWMGRLALGPGDTAHAFVELRNSSECEVVFHGNWHDTPLEGLGTGR